MFMHTKNSLKENQQNSKSKYLNAHCIYTPWYLHQANLISKYIHVIYMTSKFYSEPAYIGDYIIKPVDKIIKIPIKCN